MSTILIVDDEPSARMVLESILKVDGYMLAFAANGYEALKQASALTPDLILLDVMMPGIDGFEVCRQLRTTPRLADVPIIMITALDDRDSRLQGIEAGADDFISKPIDRIEMRARVKMIIKLNRYRRLMEERMKFERVVELSPNGIVIVNTTGDILLTNPAMLHLLGASTDATIIGDNILQYYPPEQHEQCLAALQRVLADPTYGDRFETIWQRLDGTRFSSEVDVGYIEWDGRPAIQMIVRDITRRKQIESDLNTAYKHMVEMNQQIQRSRDVLRAIFDGMDSALALIDHTGIILAINQALADLLGNSPDNLVNQSWTAAYTATGGSFPGRLILQTLADGRARTQRSTFVAPDGQHRILDIRTLPIQDAHHAAHAIIAHIVDVTEQVQLEAMALDNERFAANGKLAATVAHEVNTPLHTIKTSLYLAEKSAEEEKRSTYLRLAQEEIDRVSHILRQLLDVYRTSDGALVEIDCNAQIERMLLLTGSTLARQGIHVVRHLSPELPPLWGYPDQMTQVLLNLLLNAVDAMPNGGELTIATRVEEQTADSASRLSLVIELTDSGVGIPADLQSRIFEPFFTTKPAGTGLGLAVSQKLITQHRGKLTVRSNAGAGSTFTIVLPLYHEDQEEA